MISLTQFRRKTVATLSIAAFMIASMLGFPSGTHAAVSSTFSVTTTTPNTPTTTIVFPDLSGGAAASATTTISIAPLSGGVDGSAETRATATFDVTGTTGSTTSITVNSTEILGASIDFGADAPTTAAALAAQINAFSSTSGGYTATSSGSTVTITAPVGSGSTLNGASLDVSASDYISGATSFAGGVDGTAGVSATATTTSFASVTSNAGADLTLNIGSTTITLIGGNSGAQAAAAVAAAINADGSNPYTASVVSADQVLLTAKVAGTAGNSAVIASDLEYNASPAVSAFTTSTTFVGTANGSTTDLTLNIGSTTITLTGSLSASDAASTTAAAINADPTNPYHASVVSGNQIELSADTAGISGNGPVVASDLSYNTTAEVVTFTPGNVTAGETFRATINGTDYDYLANGSSTVATVTGDLSAQMDANAAVSCSDTGSTIVCTSENPGTSFSANAQVIAAPGGSGSSGLSPITISSNGASTACARIGDVVTLSFTSSYALGASTTAMIDGHSVNVTSLGSNQYAASTTLNASTTEGVLSFSITPFDMSGNQGTTTASTTNNSSVVFDMTAPQITLNGDANMSAFVGTQFSDPGVTVSDALDAQVSTTTIGTVNTSVPGTYTITYTATDCAGNTATTTRTVAVNGGGNGGGSIIDQSGNTGGGSNTTTNTGSNTSGGTVTTSSATAEVLPPITIGPSVSFTTPQVLGISTFRFTRTLGVGSRGDDVAELQRKLTELGIYRGPITGYYGTLTRAAVRTFQSGLGLSVTGALGAVEIDILNNS